MNNNLLNTINEFDFTKYIESIKEAIINITREQLFNNISITIKEYKDKSKENYKESLYLLEALKPFMDNETIQNIDKFYKVLEDVDAMRMIVNSLLTNKRNDDDLEYKPKKILDQQGDLIFEDNTVYEIDKECKPSITCQSMNNKNQNIIALCLLMLNNK